MFDPNLKIETKRLIIRLIDLKDKEAFFNLIFHDHDVLKYFVADYVENIEDFDMQKKIDYTLNTQRYFMSVELKESHEVIGTILECDTPSRFFNSVEIGYAYGKKYWNQGYATEALQAWIDFELNIQHVHKVICSHFEENIASGKVMQKCGMIYEYKSIEEIYYHDKYSNLVYYYLLNNKY